MGANKTAAYLYKGYVDYAVKKYYDDAREYELGGELGTPPKLIGQTNFAETVLGVNPISFSQWTLGVRVPDDENTAKLVEFYGPELYRVLGVPEKIPESMMPLAELWPYLSEEFRASMIEAAKKKVEQHGLFFDFGAVA